MSSPLSIGSTSTIITIGIVLVASCAARADKPKGRESASPIAVPPAVPARPHAKLFYNDQELNGATITLERSNPDPRLCTAMHVWATKPSSWTRPLMLAAKRDKQGLACLMLQVNYL